MGTKVLDVLFFIGDFPPVPKEHWFIANTINEYINYYYYIYLVTLSGLSWKEAGCPSISHIISSREKIWSLLVYFPSAG